MALELNYDSQDDIPEAHRELFTEKDEKWHLTGINVMVTSADVDKLNTALGKERTAHKETKKKVSVWGDMDQAKVVTDLEELTELRAAKEAWDEEDKDGAAKFEAKVEATVKARTATIEAQLNKKVVELETTNGTLSEENTGFKQANVIRTIGDAVRSAAVTAKVIDSAVDDVMMLAERVFEIDDEGKVLTKDQVGVTPGIEADIWLSEMQEKRPHWWPNSTGGGASGGKGNVGFPDNPFTGEHWNLTKQAEAHRADAGKAVRMATAAGTKLGGLRPKTAVSGK